jgi:hypothetical protein
MDIFGGSELAAAAVGIDNLPKRHNDTNEGAQHIVPKGHVTDTLTSCGRGTLFQLVLQHDFPLRLFGPGCKHEHRVREQLD